MSEIAELREIAQKNSEGLATLTKSFNVLTDRLQKTPAPGTQASDVFGAPTARTGENIMSSRGFSFLKMVGLLTGDCQPDQAKIEIDVHERMHNCLCKEMGNAGYTYGGKGLTGINRFLAPLASSYFPEDVVNRPFRQEMKQLVVAGTDGADYDEAKWIRQKQLKALGYSAKDLSWLDEFRGGALVAPPEFGELIELLRNKEALINAGAKTIPLPPQGRLKFPRQTAASTTYWVGENKRITNSDPGTGEINMQAKKLAVLIRAPNELIRFASPAAEALMRDDMTKSLALGLDLAGLEGAGGDVQPRGILNMPGINTVASSDARANGDRIVGQDIYRMVAVVEESNAEFEGWIMRPKTLYKYYQLRADSVAQGDGAGPYLFHLIREASEGVEASLAGYKVTKSTQISQVRAKGSATNLTYVIGGMWSDLMIGMFGAIEFAATTLGDTAFQNDQTWVRGILSADIAARHEAAFCLLDNLDTTI